MKGLATLAVLIVTAAIVTVAQSGHEFPVYPGYYPHEIRIETIPADRAADLLLKGKIQAYVGSELATASAPKDSIGAIESLGSFVIVRINPDSPLARDPASTCAVGQTVIRSLAPRHGEMVFHPYPVTPFHGDYLHHVDLAESAKARFTQSPRETSLAAGVRGLKLRATGALAEGLVPKEWQTKTSVWDAAVEEVNVVDLVAPSITATNGWLGPPWAKMGWFHAALLLAASVDDPAVRDRVQADLRRLQSGAYESAVARINLERELVTSLISNCRSMIVGYTVKREYVSTEYSAGIENIGFDSIDGLNSPIFIRTAKLKDFPWNGWLSLGTDAHPMAAWNPIAGFTDRFGRLMWWAMGDPAMIPSPNGAGWILNRTSDVQASPHR
ncbi:MAG TPA: hypothetical protein VKG21_19755 [Casimicrobiaceae bacterium]|nr:hypothetical protein [Casimicrobiaceae bacterium]